MSTQTTGPAYRIVTPRLVIRCWNPSDAVMLRSAINASLDHLIAWMPWARNEPEDIQKKIERLRQSRGKFDLGQDFGFGIFNRDESQVLGGTGLHTRIGEGAREIGYWIHKEFTNQGLATESTAALVKVAFEIERVERIEIHCDIRNAPSAAVPRKLGFTHETTVRRRISPDTDPVDDMIWVLLADQYPSSPAAGAGIEAYDVVERRIL